MSSDRTDHTLLHLSSEDTPERDRVAVWREVVGRAMLRIDVEPLPDVQFHADVTIRALPGLAVASGTFCGTRERRTPELMADGNDSLALVVNMAGPFHASQRGQECDLGAGDAFFLSCGEASQFIRPSLGRMSGVVLPYALLAPQLRLVDDAIGRLIPRDSAALRMLAGYLTTLEGTLPSATPALREAAARHVCDLVALTIGATPDAAFLARGRGVGAARLASIKADVAAGLSRRDVAAAAIAERHRMTPRHLQRLFEAEGTTFSAFVLDLRLARAYRMLLDPRFAQRTIKAIANETGFGDRSYFNRAFRQRYGGSPSDLRAASRARAGN
jgi:AraC-like DNA-binding protein